MSAYTRNSRITVRIFTHEREVFEQHSFLVGNDQGGLTKRLATIPVEAEITTLREFRQLVEVQNDRGMLRRTALFQELLSLAFSLPNPFNYPDEDLRKYRFGVFAEEGDEVPTLIPLEVEDDLLAVKALKDVITEDLLLIPQSQIRPDGFMSVIDDHSSSHGLAVQSLMRQQQQRREKYRQQEEQEGGSLASPSVVSQGSPGSASVSFALDQGAGLLETKLDAGEARFAEEDGGTTIASTSLASLGSQS